MFKTVTITVIDGSNVKAKTMKFHGKKMPKDLDLFISKYVGERPTKEERR